MDFLIDFEAVLEPPTPGEPPARERAEATEGVGGGLKSSFLVTYYLLLLSYYLTYLLCALGGLIYTP